MATIIKFPEERRTARAGVSPITPGETATVIILPVIRIEWHGDGPSGGLVTGGAAGRGRRRPAGRP